MTKLVLVQANPFLAFAEIDEPVAYSFNQSEQVAAGNDDHDASVGKGMRGKPVIPLSSPYCSWMVLCRLLAELMGPQLQDIIPGTMADDEVEKQNQYIHEAPSGSVPVAHNGLDYISLRHHY